MCEQDDKNSTRSKQAEKGEAGKKSKKPTLKQENDKLRKTIEEQAEALEYAQDVALNSVSDGIIGVEFPESNRPRHIRYWAAHFGIGVKQMAKVIKDNKVCWSGTHAQNCFICMEDIFSGLMHKFDNATAVAAEDASEET